MIFDLCDNALSYYFAFMHIHKHIHPANACRCPWSRDPVDGHFSTTL